MDFKDVTMWLGVQTFKGRRHEFYHDFAEALEDKDTPLNYLTTLERRARERKDVMADVFELWIRRLEDRSFPEAIVGTVPDSDVLILEAATRKGSLIDGLRFLSDAIKASEKMSGALTKAIAGPFVLLAMLIGMLLVYSYFVVPIIVPLIKPENWPPIGRALYALTSFVTTYGLYVAGAFIVLGIAFVRSLSRWSGPTRVWADNYLLPYTIYRDYHGSLFLVMLAALMQAKVSIKEALETVQQRASGWLGWHIEEILGRLPRAGKNQAVAFTTGVFGQRLTDRVVDFGGRQNFEEAVEKIGLQSIDKTMEFTVKAANTLNKILIFASAALMVFMIAGVMTTTQEVQKEVKKSAYGGSMRK